MTFVSERAIKAVRKPHQCCACSTNINVGEPAANWAGMTDGDFMSVYYHVDCRAAEVALNKLQDSNWDEWTGLYDLDREDWPWLLDEFPTVAARKGITLALLEAS